MRFRIAWFAMMWEKRWTKLNALKAQAYPAATEFIDTTNHMAKAQFKKLGTRPNGALEASK